ncbi:MAG TPA: hypothetical protein VKA50_04640 [Gammaproteobacteria bacterium]|nr:hypothetical protein [Gammaproteobacteria bacterium]
MPLIIRPTLLLLWLSLPALALAGAAAQEVQRTRALAGPVLTQGASDRALVAHLRAVHQRNPGANIEELVFLVFRESYMDQMKDKKYWLAKLKRYNELHKAMRDYLEELNGASGELNARPGGTTVAGSGPTGHALNRMAAALRRFEAALRRSRGLNPADRRALNAMIVRDRQFIRASRRLSAQGRAISRSPTPPNHRTLRQPAPANGTLRIPPR